MCFMNYKYSIVIPTINEEKRLPPVINGLKKVFKNVQIIVVDDNSEDKTVEIANRFSNVIVISRSQRLGKGSAVIEGLKRAEGRIIGFIDADMSIPPEDVLEVFEKANDCVAIASRRHRYSTVLENQPITRRLASRVYNMLVKALFGLPFNDTQCGCKAMGSAAAQNIIGEMKSKGFEFDVELLWIAKRKGIKIEVVPIRWAHQKGSKFSLSAAPRMLTALIMLRFK